jgi:hypothetical protein
MGNFLQISERFNGPLDSGQGGFSAGAIASFLDPPEGPIEVTLRRPVPLDTRLDVVQENNESVRVLHGETLIAEGRSVPALEVDVPTPVTPDEARRASANYRGVSDGVFSRCFVCGVDREDAFGVFAGEVEGRELVASPWTPPFWTAGRSGNVLPEFIWSVLDCPTFFAAYIAQDLPMSVLAQLTARIDGAIQAGEEHVVMAWPAEADGRKRYAEAAVVTADGEPRALARALMIEPRAAR